MSKSAPVIGRIPAEIHARAAELGVIVETYTEVIAGHGPTGRVAWAVSHIVTQGDAPRFRYGSDSTHEHARASLRHALYQLEAAKTAD